MKSEQEIPGLLPRVILATFAASWFFGPASLLLAFGMGFESGYTTSNNKEVADRVGHGFVGGFIGVLAGFMGVLAFVLVVDLVSWTTGIHIRDTSFIGRLKQE